LDLALAVAGKIVCNEVSANKEIILKVIKRAFSKVVDHDKIVIRISPSDLKIVEDSKSQFLEFVDNIERITIEEDKTIQDGGCVIETNLGEIDARIGKQLQAIEEVFELELQ